MAQMVSARIRRRQTVHEALTNRQWNTCISGGITMNGIAEYLDLWRTLQDVILNDQPNRTIWHWTPDGIYTSKSAYMMLHAGSAKFRGHRLIWKTWAPLKVKVFLWLAFRRCHWTADRRARHGRTGGQARMLPM